MIIAAVWLALLGPVAEAGDQGGQLYRSHCATCHGVNGDGNGPSARYLEPKPRDFTKGLFKFRTSAPGTPPTVSDLARTIRRGIPGTPMPSFRKQLSADEINQLAAYVQGFSDRWEEGSSERAEWPEVPELSDEMAARGKETYQTVCVVCHGEAGKGNGPASKQLEDAWGRKIKPRNYTRGVFKYGTQPEELFVVISNGIEGTPMAVWGERMTEDQRWELVAYLMTFLPKRPREPLGQYPVHGTSP